MGDGSVPTPLALPRFGRYPEYRDASVEWLGVIPAHWEVTRLKECANAWLSNVDKKSVEDEFEVRLCNYVDVYYHDRIHNEMDFMTATATPDQVRRFSLREGDVLITKDSETWTDIAVPALVVEDLADVLCGYHLALIRPQPNCVGAFLCRAIGAAGPQDQYHVSANGITRFGLTVYAIRNSSLPLPPLPEQRSIAEFLDRETARLDALVAKQHELIKLLQEKRTALISRAVTKGLRTSVPMQESGVEWLGKIPAHWGVKRLKECATVWLSNVDKKSAKGEPGVRLCNYVDVYYREQIDAQMDFMAATATPDQVRRFSLREGDVLITKDSETWTDIAVPALVTEDLPGVLCGYHLALIRPRSDYLGGFLARAIGAIGPRDQYHISANGITRFGLTADAIRTGLLPSPPLPEQRGIADFLDHETARIDAMTAKVTEAIERLNEYRTALISAAVTGKIDVRHHGEHMAPVNPPTPQVRP